MKTVRNCLYNSGDGKKSRKMWNNGYSLLWSHISNLQKEDSSNPLKLVPKLKFEYVNLTSYSSMRVNLAAQVLSSTVYKVLDKFGDASVCETVKLCYYMDMFFDCLNVRSMNEAQFKRKEFLKPDVLFLVSNLFFLNSST